MRPAFSLIVAAIVLAPLPLAAQAPRPAAPAQAQPAVPPAKPYKAVAVKLPAPLADATFEAFRKQLGEAAQKKDRAALARLVVANGFFWEGEKGDRADKKKSGIDNLVAALGLAKKDGEGWDMLGGYSADPTAMPMGEKKDILCAPADPAFDEKELEDVAKATQTDPGDWGYPVGDGIEVRSGPQASTPVSEKLGLHFVRVMPDSPAPAPNQMPMLKIVTPSGKTGFVTADAIAPLGSDQLCYVKDAGGWKITGFIGGE